MWQDCEHFAIVKPNQPVFGEIFLPTHKRQSSEIGKSWNPIIFLSFPLCSRCFFQQVFKINKKLGPLSELLPLEFFDIVSGDEQRDDQEPEEDGVGPAEASEEWHGVGKQNVLRHQEEFLAAGWLGIRWGSLGQLHQHGLKETEAVSFAVGL